MIRFSGLQGLFHKENWTSGYDRLSRGQSQASVVTVEDDFESRSRGMTSVS